MGLLDTILKDDNRRLKKFAKTEEKLSKRINKFDSDTFDTSLRPLVSLARTYEEYSICANLFKKWADYVIDVDLAYKVKLNPVFPIIVWNHFQSSLIDGLLSLLITKQFEEVIKYANLLIAIKKIIYDIQVNSKTIINQKDTLFTVIYLYKAFALYKMNSHYEALKIFKDNPNFNITFTTQENNDLIKEVFKEYNNKIESKYFINLIEELLDETLGIMII